jgi:hypothetical protein
MNLRGKGGRGRSTPWKYVMALFGLGLVIGATDSRASDWAIQQIEEGRRQQLGIVTTDPSVPTAERRRSRSTARTTRNTRTASRGDTRRDFNDAPSYTRSTGRSLSGGGVTWLASSGCLNASLRSVIASVASNFGPVTVNSTCRSHAHNRRVGGAPRSMHLTGDAADFRVRGASPGAVYAFLRGRVGGIKHYGGGLFHIDTGARRTW